ncbi:MAG TPA: hypothetical protein VH247_04220 [Thermoleophilaceae bacterium]|nr:hypothetical protein [Thermoleophilaceae bacterium]
MLALATALARHQLAQLRRPARLPVTALGVPGTPLRGRRLNALTHGGQQQRPGQDSNLRPAD